MPCGSQKKKLKLYSICSIRRKKIVNFMLWRLASVILTSCHRECWVWNVQMEIYRYNINQISIKSNNLIWCLFMYPKTLNRKWEILRLGRGQGKKTGKSVCRLWGTVTGEGTREENREVCVQAVGDSDWEGQGKRTRKSMCRL